MVDARRRKPTISRTTSSEQLDQRLPDRERLYAYEGGVVSGAVTSEGFALISEWKMDDVASATIYHFESFRDAESWHDGPDSHSTGTLRARTAAYRALRERFR